MSLSYPVDAIIARIESAQDPRAIWQIARDGMLLLKHLDTVTDKSIASVSRKFHSDLRNLAVLGFISDSSILGDVRRTVKDAVADAYIEGLVAGGINAEEMSNDDALQIIELSATQLEYVTDFVRAIRDARDDKAAQRNILGTRIDLWTTAIEMAGTAGLNSAKHNEMVIFSGEDGKENCPTCRKLKGQKHRRRWFEEKGLVPRDPRFRDNFECGGYNCQHVLISLT